MCFSRCSAFFLLVYAVVCGILLTPYCLLPTSVNAADEPFTYPANWGGTGLMEIPTARVMKEDSLRIGAGQVKPYRYYYGAISPLKGLEIDGRITEILDVSSGLPGQNNNKDKALDFKYQFLSEGKYMPALAIGFMDPHGTRLYPSQYIVASKQIYPFDFTLGFGNGRFGREPLPSQDEGIKLEIFSNTGDWLRDSQFFWGVQFAPSEKYALMFEFSPVKYHRQIRDAAQDKYFTDPVPSKFNFGVRYKPTKWSEIDVSYQRGNQIGVNVSMAFDIGKPLIPIYDRMYRETPVDILDPVNQRITRLLYNSGFSDIGIFVDGGDIWISARNEKYFYPAGAIGIMIAMLPGILPENIINVHIILKENGIPVIEFITTRSDIHELYEEKLKPHEFYYLSKINTDISEVPGISARHKKLFRYDIKPSFETFLNDPSGFFKYRFGATGWISYHPWRGASVVTGLAMYPLNNISTSNEPLSIPVRSDHVFYKDENLSLDRLMFEQIEKITPRIYGKIAAGLLEVQYAGLDAEIAMPVLDGKILLGVSGSAVKKRDDDNPFKLKEDPVKEIFTTGFLNTRINIPGIEVAFDVKAGRFLAGDHGVRLTVSKHIRGVTVWAWYSVTDTSVFSDDYNEGYHDKGIGISIPLRLFKGSDSRTVYPYSISPWTRDTGQDIDHFNPLFDFMGRNTKIYIDKDRQMLYR